VSGLDTPVEYIPFVHIILCAISLVLPLGLYRLGQVILDERGARYCFLFGLLWWHFAYFAHKPMPGILATYALVWCCVFFYRPPTRRNLLLMGALAGGVLVLRYQLLPVIGILGLFLLVRLTWRSWPALLTFCGVILLAGLVDLWTWGGFLFSFFENFRLNFEYNISAVFGVSGWDYYAYVVARETAGLVALGALGAVLILKRSWPLLIAVLAGVIALHIPAHKEFRFLIWALPFVFLGVSACLRPMDRWLEGRGIPLGTAFVALLIWSGAILGYLVASNHAWHAKALDLRAAFVTLSKDPAVTGVDASGTGIRWPASYGYFTLGHAVPVYFAEYAATPSSEERAARAPHISHIVTDRDAAAPVGFELLQEIDSLRIWAASEPKQQVAVTDLQQRLSLPADFLQDIPPRTDGFRMMPQDIHPGRFN
jgi:hypothetical protein